MRTSIATAIALFLLYAALLHIAPEPSRRKLQSQWQENRRTVEQYFQHRVPQDTVFVGSSLTRRLHVQDQLSCAYNLAVDGESTLTGLHAIRAAGYKPLKVFAEINVPERPVNQSLIDHGRSKLLSVSPVFWTDHIPTNYFYSTISSWRQREIIAPPASPAARASELARQTAAYGKPLDAKALERSLVAYRNIVAELESEGVKVLLFEMPVHPSLEGSTRATQIRAAFVNAFGPSNVLSVQQLAQGIAIDTVDGVHLSADEARAVVANLARLRAC